MDIKKTIAILVLLGICLFLYLLALDSYCDQGEKFDSGICFVTRYLPF
ncbi:PhoP/PhoQ regulator MgrB [Photorhabdus tasmaniensis]|uniref:PhoP regulon feedback inhibition membrane protein MgrB n=4 Tax=Photorhabdus TaxID=29487 RepID=A0A4R4K724_9GAMM|nr:MULTISPECIES: PhoP/PhoQ regulator MgrB [Photorhabdus]MCT8347162.1 PhoP/PhoQ regulator MgrB [Photorhabdus temperata]MCC8421655.1 PhoP/PhoQ regulator MgrB [Photorhabdus thracensis]MQL46819.1 PhoP/PhoQ regulator MgrB [Photorhabdus khanii]NHB86832.1 PhoP regulon feedback inhibition membrane protein MgrB [Photorhabdus tasmaniensis]NHB96056.1 PhoP regulon feedback inhibition membrane protein MgrB [Photorhabdus stackebrandtii]